MIVKYCDKCEKIIPEEEWNIREEDMFPDGYYDVTVHRPYKFEDGEIAHLGYYSPDLCSECRKKLTNTMNRFLGTKLLKPEIIARRCTCAPVPCNNG